MVLEGAFELKNFSKQKQEMYKEIKGIIFESSVIYTHVSFSEMESLRYVKLPSTVELVTNESFRGCKNLITCQIYKSSLKLPKDIFRDNEAFEGVIYIE